MDTSVARGGERSREGPQMNNFCYHSFKKKKKSSAKMLHHGNHAPTTRGIQPFPTTKGAPRPWNRDQWPRGHTSSFIFINPEGKILNSIYPELGEKSVSKPQIQAENGSVASFPGGTQRKNEMNEIFKDKALAGFTSTVSVKPPRSLPEPHPL